MNTKTQTATLLASINFLFENYSAKEIEDTLFQSFERANILSEGDHDDDREKRSAIHTELRTIFRTIADCPEIIPQIKKQWKTIQKPNTTEIT